MGSRKTFAVLATYGYGLTYLTQGNDGNIYFFNRAEGSLNKIVYVDTDKPVIVSEPKSISVIEGQRGVLSVVAIGEPTLTYQWQKNGANITNANKSTYSFNNAGPRRAGNYRCIVTNTFGTDISAVATVQ